MEQGYLYIETSDSHPGLLRVLTAIRKPAVPERHCDPEVRYIACFKDLQVAQMHAHTALRRRLVDIDNHVYRGDVIDAIAAVEADDVWHERAYLDPELDEANHELIENKIARRVERRQRVNHIFDLVGKAAIGLLMANLLVLSAAA